MSHVLWLKSLLFMNFGGADFIDTSVHNCFAMKTEAQLGRCNRVFNVGSLAEESVEEIKKYFDTVYFTWVIDKTEQENITLLEKCGLSFKGFYPALCLELSQLQTLVLSNNITIKEVIDEEAFAQWISIASQNYPYLENKAELAKALHVLQGRAQANLKLFLGYYKGHPAAVSMLIYHGEDVSVHMVGTLPEFRHKGLGRAMIEAPLSIARDKGFKRAILMSSPAGLTLAKKIGFTEYATYAIYGNY